MRIVATTRRGGASLARIASVAFAVSMLATLPAAPSVAARPAGLPPEAERPSIVLLMLDDVAAIDDRLWQRLPTIKRLFLDQGIRFTDYIGNDPLCCPGRANVLTGQWTLHHGVDLNDARLFDPTVTIATELQEQGYWTGIFGKYFNRTKALVNRFPPGWNAAWIHSGAYWRYVAFRNGQRLQLDDALADYSTAAMRRAALSALKAVPVDQPVFLWLAPFAAHSGGDQSGVGNGQPAPLPRDVGAPACADTPAWWTPALDDPNMASKPAYLHGLSPLPPRPLVKQCEALRSVDRSLGKVLAAFAAAGRPEPMVILTGDNGMALGAHRARGKGAPYATPLPLMIHWPALVGTAPAIVRTTVSNVDLAPTLCAIVGCTMGPFPNGHDVDGISFLPLLLDVAAVNRTARAGERRRAPGGIRRRANGRIAGLALGREVVFEEHTSSDPDRMPSWEGLRTTNEAPMGRWVYTEYETGEKELYDISGGPCWTWRPGDPGDPCQLVNLAGDPDHAALQARLALTLARREESPLRLQRSRR